jgi:FAD/FMN-containing dehydrogenase
MSSSILPSKRLLCPGDPAYEPIVNRAKRTVRIAAGTRWDEVDAATAPHGLAAAGDVGHLTRRFGLPFDDLLEADVVFPDGRVLRAAPDEHPGLYWALRGGAEIGQVTSSLYRLHRTGPVVGGPTYWAIEHAEAVLEAYLAFLPSAPLTLTGAFTLRSVPFPEARRVAGVLWCADSAAAIEPFLAGLPEPLLHGVQPLPHSVLRRTFATAGERSYLRELPAALPETVTLHPVDGATHDLACGDTAWAHRGACWCAVSPVRLDAPAPCDHGWECSHELAERLAAMRATYLSGR